MVRLITDVVGYVTEKGTNNRPTLVRTFFFAFISNKHVISTSLALIKGPAHEKCELGFALSHCTCVFFSHCVGGAWETEVTDAAMEKGAGGGGFGEGEARRKLGNSSVVAAGSTSLQQMGARVKETYLDIVPIASREPDIGSSFSFQVSFVLSFFLLVWLFLFVCLL